MRCGLWGKMASPRCGFYLERGGEGDFGGGGGAVELPADGGSAEGGEIAAAAVRGAVDDLPGGGCAYLHGGFDAANVGDSIGRAGNEVGGVDEGSGGGSRDVHEF